MDDITINKLLKRFEKLSCFEGVFGKDEVPNIVVSNYPSCYIFNEGSFAKGTGTHWVAIYIDDNGVLDYYDSYGKLPLVKEIKDFVKGYKLNYNSKRIQSYQSYVCGQHCIFFLVRRHKGNSIDYIVQNYFTNSVTFNDSYVNQFVKVRYGI